MDDWLYDDCRLENNGIIRKGCGYNKSFKFNTTLSKKMNMNLITWCNTNCEGNFGCYFKDTMVNERVKRSTVFTFENKYDCFNFKLKQL